MASEVTALLVALRAWQKAVRQLRHQDKPLTERRLALKAAEQQVIDQLATPAVEVAINDLIQASAAELATAAALRSLLQQAPEQFLSTEINSMQPMDVSHTTLQKLITRYLQTPDIERPLNDSEQISNLFMQLSAAVLAEHEATIALSRQPKKQRRRDLSLASLQTAIGIGLVAGNTQVDAAIANSSYILGGNALLTALQNFVGKADSGS